MYVEVDEYQVPPILIGDSIYPSLTWLLASYKRLPGQPILSPAKKTFNKKLSRARIYSEIAFGRLKATFKEVGWRSGLDIEFFPAVIHTCCILYNILVDFKEVNFESVFTEVDVLNATLARDQLAYDQEPLVDCMHIEGSAFRDVLCRYINEL